MNNRIKSAFPLQSHTEKTDDQLIQDYAIDHGFTQVIIIGVNDRNEYSTEVHADNDTELKLANRNLKEITKTLREEGLTPRLI